MLTPRELSTVRAALRYWEEEMCPHGEMAMRPYLDRPNHPPLTANQVTQVRQALVDSVRYAAYDPQGNQIQGELISDYEQARKAAGDPILATVILPSSPERAA